MFRVTITTHSIIRFPGTTASLFSIVMTSSSQDLNYMRRRREMRCRRIAMPKRSAFVAHKVP